jgi:Cof subfamily protein (haloacid dehalogenase superfamily)
MELTMSNSPLKGTLLVSDLDGTFISAQGIIPPRNIEAIERFTRKGGLFTIAAAKYACQVAVNAPAIVLNGAAIYDFGKKEILWSKYLPDGVSNLLEGVYKHFPDVGIEIYAGDNVYIVNNNEYTKRHVEYEKLNSIDVDLRNTPEKWNKALLAAAGARLAEVSEYVKGLRHGAWEYVYSNSIYFEILPAGITKGTAVRRLADMLNISHGRIMAIGDYYNDLALIQTAAVSAVPAGAPDDLKAEADVVVGLCGEGAVADFIEYIEAHFGADTD